MEKKQFKLEFNFNSSPRILFNRLSTTSGLAEWFADDVNFENNQKTFIFTWDGHESKANIIAQKDLTFIRFRWEDEENEKAYFEFKINVEELTGDVALIITDFAEADEIDDAIQLWETQIEQLKTILGS
ncbi:MAG: START-like domain-containing protein [Bacteroidales bacterium]|jgi:uncharacterized protein YndB with AHSA1/START domain|nr:START-like domain-containing protein [Bacteroidales bacterium]NLK81346.1 SRPBCC domain-containing protein [Bacteroidales bacterium]HPY83089.1 START-like domain-containing protein [Bacteroidales bacterium]